MSRDFERFLHLGPQGKQKRETPAGSLTVVHVKRRTGGTTGVLPNLAHNWTRCRYKPKGRIP